MLIHFDKTKDLSILPEDKWIPFLGDLFFQQCLEAIKKKGFFSVALAGGTSPKKLYEYLTKHPLMAKIPKDKVHLFFGDERAVGPEDPESNYKMALDAGFAQWKIPTQNIHRMRAESEIEKSAEEYEKQITTLLGSQGFDLILLGMGDDGHTASLFPNTSALQEKKRKVVANFIPQKNCWRMTLTYPMINASKQIVFLVSGASKQAMIAKLFSEQGNQFPAYYVGSLQSKALWVLDEKAAGCLNKLKT